MRSIDIEQLTQEEKVILLFKLLGYSVSPWTEPQQLAYLLGILQCPKGHILSGEGLTVRSSSFPVRSTEKEYEVFPDVIFKIFIEDGLIYPDDSGEETREFSDSGKWTVITCGHEGHGSWFYVPQGILEDLKKTLPEE